MAPRSPDPKFPASPCDPTVIRAAYRSPRAAIAPPPPRFPRAKPAIASAPPEPPNGTRKTLIFLIIVFILFENELVK